MTISAENIQACQEALFLLRQDVGLPTVEGAASDTSIEWAKCRIAFGAAVTEVWNAHDWAVQLRMDAAEAEAAAHDCAGWSEPMRRALACCVARELAVPLAGRVQDLQNWDAMYQRKLVYARCRSLEAERRAVDDPVHAELLSVLVPRFSESEGPSLPRSVKSITDRADALADSSRHAVLSAHAWNFARAEDPTPSCRVPSGNAYPFASEVPPGCVHLEAVLGESGELNDWKLFGRTIVSMQPVRSAVYVRDDRRPMKWPPLVKRAFVFRLAADVAQTEVPGLLAAMEQKYAEALAEAKLRDSRESNTPRDAWGRNHYADAMAGRAPGAPRPPRHAFHGLV